MYKLNKPHLRAPYCEEPPGTEEKLTLETDTVFSCKTNKLNGCNRHRGAAGAKEILDIIPCFNFA
jgi:hypothetical protein